MNYEMEGPELATEVTRTYHVTLFRGVNLTSSGCELCPISSANSAPSEKHLNLAAISLPSTFYGPRHWWCLRRSATPSDRLQMHIGERR